MAFRMRNFRKDATQYASDEMNWFDLDVEDINLKGRNLRLKGGVMSGNCDRLSFREKSGFVCHLMSGSAKVGNGKTIVDNLRIIDNWSDIDIPNLKMTYKDTDAWSDFINAVRLQGDIRPSMVSMNTLGYFAPALKRFRMTANLNGHVEGYINDLHLNNITFESADAKVSPNGTMPMDAAFPATSAVPSSACRIHRACCWKRMSGKSVSHPVDWSASSRAGHLTQH